MAGGLLTLMAAVLLGVSFLAIRSELTMPKLTLTSDNQVQIDYPMYNFSFAISEIQNITLVDESAFQQEIERRIDKPICAGSLSLEGAGEIKAVYREE